MDLHAILVLGHIIGTILGAGGSVVAEAQIIRALRDDKVSDDEKALMHANYTLIRVGLALIIVSGLALVWLFLMQGNDWVLKSAKLWVKEIMVVVIIINAYALTKRFVPLWLGSAISFTSWWGAVLLGMWRKVPYSFTTIIISYIISIFIVAYVLHLIRKKFSSRK